MKVSVYGRCWDENSRPDRVVRQEVQEQNASQYDVKGGRKGLDAVDNVIKITE